VQIYHHYKRHGIQTEVMGASFRNTGQFVADAIALEALVDEIKAAGR
jgi:transaldolase